MKKLIALTLTLILAISVFSSCSGDTEETTLSDIETTAASATNEPEIQSASAGTESTTVLEENKETVAANTAESTTESGVFYVG